MTEPPDGPPSQDTSFAVATAAAARITAAAIDAKVLTSPADIFQFMLDAYQTAATHIPPAPRVK